MSGLLETAWKIGFLVSITLKWFPPYMINNIRKKEKKPIHVLFCLVDHYEPGAGGKGTEEEVERVRFLTNTYPGLADKHKDFFGNVPKRTWFFPPEFHRNGNLRQLVALCEKGYGEIELHLHHGKTRSDTSGNLRKTILQCISEYGRFGIFGSEGGQKRYGFIHGDWALDNSRRGRFCGVNNEIQILNETGCYADFTFPSPNEANPKMINTIFYAKDSPDRPKSHNAGRPVKKSRNKMGDLMIIQGPLHPFFGSRNIASLRSHSDAINGAPRVTHKRIDLWARTGIHINGKDDCVFIKVHTHGATCAHVVLGDEMEQIFDYLEMVYNDGVNYMLHYVTAREMYNIIKAIEAGEEGFNPEDYREYSVSRPIYDSSVEISEMSDSLRACLYETYCL